MENNKKMSLIITRNEYSPIQQNQRTANTNINDDNKIAFKNVTYITKNEKKIQNEESKIIINAKVQLQPEKIISINAIKHTNKDEDYSMCSFI